MFNLLPKDEKFYDEMEALAAQVVHASGELEKIVDNFPNFDGSLGTIERDRLGSKAVFQESLLRLDKAFITPIDREDILNLITEMYGVVDRIAELSQRFRLYKLQNLFPTLVGQSRNLKAMADELQNIIQGLRKKAKLSDLKSRIDVIGGIMENVRRDRDEFLGSLFSENADPLDVLKKRELHELLESAIERCEEATEVLARVLLKNS
jgi:uncharacterized protein Yka (UPF0111/DUF47 family)